MTKSHPLSWHEITELRRSVQKKIPRDRFLRTVLSASLHVGQDKKNPLRENFLASGLREAISHLLHTLAPDAEVRKCVWFVQDSNTPTVTRQQRANYIVRAGLPDSFVSGRLGIDVRRYTKPLIEIMDGLNKAAHVRPESILSNDAKIRHMADEVLSGILQMMQAVDDSRRAVVQAVEMVMFNAVFDKLIDETISELDELSTHTTFSGHYLDEVTVTKLNAVEICYRATGSVDVELQYGSDSDMKNDFGLQLEDSYPYVVTVSCDITRPMNVYIRDEDLKIDTDGFYA